MQAIGDADTLFIPNNANGVPCTSKRGRINSLSQLFSTAPHSTHGELQIMTTFGKRQG